jgi:hypothetical protein
MLLTHKIGNVIGLLKKKESNGGTYCIERQRLNPGSLLLFLHTLKYKTDLGRNPYEGCPVHV